MNITDKIKIKIDLSQLAVLTRFTKIIPVVPLNNEILDFRERYKMNAIYSIMLEINTKLKTREIKYQYNTPSKIITINLKYYEAYALNRFLISFSGAGDVYEDSVLRNVITQIDQYL